jgi:uncharacterized membrane protein
MAFCSGCGTAIADGTSMCAACSAAAPAAAPVATTSSSGSGITDNVAGALAYIAIVGLIFILIEPYNKNKFVRFHAFQSLFFAAAVFVAWFGVVILAVIPFIGWLIDFCIIVGLFVTWILLVVKAYQGNRFKLPVIGDLAEKQAGV